ncbi:MAG: hypothetical protein KatS3mg027_1390 [Bacteroidia bacterium]|nr:MAG: hypothetical protein KatS3mg027_1390 [Bacteroidia bacterium]
MKQVILHSIKNDFFVFFVFTIFHIIIYNGTRHFTELPYGLHAWRQSMNFSMVQNFKENGHNIFKPAINNLLNQDDTGNLLLEFPLLQWLASFLPDMYLSYFRWIVFIFSLIGFYYGYKLMNEICKDEVVSYAIMFIFLSIPVVLFYNANFNTDVPAISFSIASVYFWKRMLDSNQMYYGIYGFIFFTLSALLRLPAIILSLAFLCVIFLSKNHIHKSINFLFNLAASFLIIVIWYYYQHKNNNYPVSNPSEYSLFVCTADDIREIIYALKDFQFNQLGFIFRNVISYIVIFLIILLGVKQIPVWLRNFTLIGIVGGIIYMLLWFKIFNVHDYYLIPVVPVFLVILVSISCILINNLGIKNTRIIFIILAVFSIYQGYENYHLRDFSPLGYNLLTPENEEKLMLWFKYDDEIKWSKIRQLSVYKSNLLEKYGIHQKDTAICNFDQSPTYVLSLFNLKGWTLFNASFSTMDEYIKYAKKGAKFLIHFGDNPVVSDKAQDSIIRKNLVFSYYDVKFYNIQHLRR